jgi:signal transduction histidine kinase
MEPRPQNSVPPSVLPKSDSPSAEPLAEVLAKRCAFLQITDEDCRRVRLLAPLFEVYADEFIGRFYDHLLSFPATARFLTDSELVSRLRRLQGQYFNSLLRAELGPAYVEERQRIGQVHAMVGLEPQWFLGAFAQYLQHCFPHFARHAASSVETYAAAMQSLLKLILLDIGLALDAYWGQFTGHLQKALELYAQSNAELREFAHLTSHDLRTPLATVSALCEEFLDEFGGQVPAEGRRLIEAARTRVLKTKVMIDDLLSASEAAAQADQRSSVPTRSVLDEVVARVRAEIGARPILLELPDTLPDVFAHPGRLHEVFYQLLSNAVKFMDKEPGLIQITAEPGTEAHGFCVADNGPGIAEEDRTKIFAPFHRLRQHRHIPGSGLGLYFVRMIVEEQGGRIWVESRLGEGSRFCFVLPAAEFPNHLKPNPRGRVSPTTDRASGG